MNNFFYYLNVVLNLTSILLWIIAFIYSGSTLQYLKSSDTKNIRRVLLYNISMGVYYIYLIIVWLLKDYDKLMPNIEINISWSVFHLLIPVGSLIMIMHFKSKYSIRSYKLQKDVERNVAYKNTLKD